MTSLTSSGSRLKPFYTISGGEKEVNLREILESAGKGEYIEGNFGPE
jgi:hypothetical protein